MKTIFFTGKGGVGKSTLSSAVAYQLSELGHRVLAVSFDPAHNLGDIFGMKLSHKKKKVGDTLYLSEADLERAAKEYVEKNTDVLTQVYSYTKAFNLDLYFKVLRHAPGVEEYAAVTAMENVFRTEGDFDYIVFDTPPTALTLRILALPNITITWIDRLRRIRRDILKKRHTVHNISGQYLEGGVVLPYEESEDPVLQKLNELFSRYLDLYKSLKSDNNTIAVVFNPDYLSLKESERIVDGLKDLELPLRVGFTNKYDENLKDIAEDVEGSLFSNQSDVWVTRVPLQENNRVGSYKIDMDLTAPFVDGLGEG